MDIGSAQAQRTLNYEGIRELKAPLSKVDKEKIKEDGLKEVFFKVGDKEYVAYGKDLDVDKFKNSTSATFNGAKVNIGFVDDELNSASEGAGAALTSVGGYVTEGVGALAGGVTAYATTGIAATAGATITAGTLAFIGTFALAGAAIGGVVTAGVGAVYGACISADYSTINKIAK